jgi:cell division protein FtsB
MNSLQIFMIMGFLGLVMIFAIIYQHERIINLNLKIEAYQIQIEALRAQTDALGKRVDAAQKEASDQVRRLQDKSNAILNTPVSKDCDKAIAWGVDQALKMRLDA